MNSQINEMARVLIVEDEVVVAEDLKTKLESFGYSVCASVTDGRAALEAVAADRPDLALMDIVLSGDMDGIDTGVGSPESFRHAGGFRHRPHRPEPVRPGSLG